MYEEMGMTDRQFKSYIRFLLEDISEAIKEEDSKKKNEKLEKVLENLQTTLED